MDELGVVLLLEWLGYVAEELAGAVPVSVWTTSSSPLKSRTVSCALHQSVTTSAMALVTPTARSHFIKRVLSFFSMSFLP